MVHMLDELDLGMRLHRDRIEAAESPICTNDGLSAASDCILVSGRGCSSRARMVSPFGSFTGTIEPQIYPSCHATAVRFWLSTAYSSHCAREAVLRSDQVGGDALRHEIRFERDRWINQPGAAGGADADAAHQFDAADRHVVLPRHHLGGGEIHRIEARGRRNG